MTLQTDTRWISKFNLSVTSGPSLIYANGKQQVEITVEVIPAHNTTFSTEQLDTIRLVTLDDDGEFRELTGNYTVSTTRDETFQYFRPTHGAENITHSSTSTTLRRRRFYVSSTDQSYAPYTLYAAINKDDDTVYVSQTTNFNKKVVIRTVEPPRLTKNDFTFWGVDAVNHTFVTWQAGVSASEEVDIDVYHLKFKDLKQRMVRSTRVNGLSGETWRWSQLFIPAIFAPTTKITFAHIAYEVGTTETFEYRGLTAKVSHPHTMNFVRIKEHLNKSDYVEAWWHDTSWLVYDQYGNSHQIDLDPESVNTLNFWVNESYYDDSSYGAV